MPSLPAVAFCLLLALTIIFQLALAGGAPWGSVAMGGRFPGRLPPVVRVIAVVQAMVLVMLGGIVLVRDGWLLPEWHPASRKAVWGVVAFSALATLLNVMTPSKWERRIWAPVALSLLVCSLLVAVG